MHIHIFCLIFKSLAGYWNYHFQSILTQKARSWTYQFYFGKLLENPWRISPAIYRKFCHQVSSPEPIKVLPDIQIASRILELSSSEHSSSKTVIMDLWIWHREVTWEPLKNISSNLQKLFLAETTNGSMLYLQTISTESEVSGNLVCCVSMFETLTTLPESIHFGTFG